MKKKRLLIILITVVALLIFVLIFLNNNYTSKINAKLGEDGIRALILKDLSLGSKWTDVIRFLKNKNFHEIKEENDICGYTYSREKQSIDLVIEKWIPFIEDYYIAIGFNFNQDRLIKISVGFYP